MKKTFILLLIFSFYINILAQDTINLKNGKVIHAYIIEKSDTKIKYRTDSVNNVDSTFVVYLSRINSIHYVTGEVEQLCSQNPGSNFHLGVSVSDVTSPISTKHEKIKRFGININNTYSLLYSNFGIGFDYFMTKNFNSEINIGGYNNRNVEYHLSAGLKYWPIGLNTKKHIYPFTGLSYGKSSLIYYIEDTDRKTNYYHTHVHKPYPQSESDYYDFVEIPVGLSYITKFGLQVSAQYDFTIFMAWRKYFWPNLAFKLGWRF